MAGNMYNKIDILLRVPLPKGEELRVVKGTKPNGTVYTDVRTWYENDDGEMAPGKGVGKPEGPLWDAITDSLVHRNDPHVEGSTTKVFSLKEGKYVEEA